MEFNDSLLIRLPAKTKLAFNRACFHREHTMSEIVRQMITEYIEKGDE